MKLKELCVSNHPDFKITLCMDYTGMVTIADPSSGGKGRGVFDCKPLQVLWERYPMYSPSNTIMFDDLKRNYVFCKPLQVLWERYPKFSPSNTIMFDDLKRNYVLNRQNGLVIRPFKRALTSGKEDRELLRLKAYLLKIAELDTLGELDHKKWEHYARREIRAVEEEEARRPQRGDGEDQ